MIIKQPDIEAIYSYIIQTHQSDHINVTMTHINAALAKSAPLKGQTGGEGVEKVCCIGHFKAINYALQIAGTIDFPAKDISVLTSEYVSHNALYWLRELHTLMMYPVADYGLKNGTGQLFIQTNQCGTYRYTPKQLAFAPAPAPEQIQKLLHAWLKDILELDADIKDKVDNPYGLTPAQGSQMIQKSKEATFFLSCLQPFEDGNNRVAKLVENMLRLRWRMPWKTIHGPQQEEFMRDLTNYQQSPTGFMRWLKKS